jgi:hypothetical protein
MGTSASLVSTIPESLTELIDAIEAQDQSQITLCFDSLVSELDGLLEYHLESGIRLSNATSFGMDVRKVQKLRTDVINVRMYLRTDVIKTGTCLHYSAGQHASELLRKALKDYRT